jgi:hypothetical protein
MRRAVLVAVVLVALAAPARAADPPRDARKAEAAERYDRGMALLEEGDNAGALAELRRVYELAPHPQVLYNLGLLYAAMGRPVEAARALDEVLAAPGALPAARLAVARRTRDEQARRVALLDVTTSVPATIEIDGIEAARTPLAAPLPVAAGTRVVGAVSPGYLPARREVAVAGQTTTALRLELTPSELRLAHVTVRAEVPDADVLVDGERVGRTPLAGSLAVPPGARTVELRRAGYQATRREVTLADGASAELGFELREDDAGRAARGRLALAVSEPDPDVTVDGVPRGAYREPLALPPGTHRLRVARAGFLPAERLVTVPEGAEATAKVTLIPTPETRAAYKQRALLQRRWGWAGAIGGAALAAGAGATVALNRGALDRARAGDSKQAQPACTPDPVTTPGMQACTDALAAADDQFNTHQTIQNFGLVALAVGVVAAAAGAVLLVTGDDPYRYDRAPHDLDGPGGLALASWLAPGAGGVSVGGRF